MAKRKFDIIFTILLVCPILNQHGEKIVSKIITFTDIQKNQIGKAITDFLYIDDQDTVNAMIDDIEATGKISAFGVGSLLTYNHLQEPTQAYKHDLEALFGISPEDLIEGGKGSANGIRADFCCFDNTYRGTPENPGITLGCEKIEDAEADGGFVTANLAKIVTAEPGSQEHAIQLTNAANLVNLYLEEFNNREFPAGMPIYKFEILDVTAEDGRAQKAIACIADNEGPLYTRNSTNDYAARQEKTISHFPDNAEGMERTAQVIAESMGNPLKENGEQKARGAVTNLDYLKATIKGYMDREMRIPPGMIKLYNKSIEYRMNMDLSDREKLEQFEARGANSNAPTAGAAFGSVAIIHNNLMTPANDPGPGQQRELA